MEVSQNLDTVVTIDTTKSRRFVRAQGGIEDHLATLRAFAGEPCALDVVAELLVGDNLVAPLARPRGVGGKDVGLRKATIRAGIKAPNDQSGMSGMSYTFGHRVIIANESDGLGDYSRHGFAGIVELDDHWVLGQNKMSVTDDAWDQLCDEIHARIRPMLEKLRNSSLAMRMDMLRANVTSLLSGGIGAVQPSGWHRKKGGPPRRRRSDGARPRGSGALKIDFYNDDEDRRAGYVESNGTRVQINAAKVLTSGAIERGDAAWLGLLARGLWSNSDAAGMLFPEAKREVYEDLLGDFCASQVQMVQLVEAVTK